jgi:polar amino acid transport system substrate-binding protein
MLFRLASGSVSCPHSVRVRAAVGLALWAITCAPGAAQELAPTGRLRVAFLGTNPVHARVDPKTGAIAGPVADLVQEIARRTGVPFALMPAPDAAGVIGHVQAGTADVGVLAYETARAREVDFAGPFAVMLSSYLVPAGSPITTLAEADRAGVTIGAVRGVTQEIHLSTHLAQARIRMYDAMPPQAELQRLLTTDALQAFGLNRQRGEDAVVASGGALRLVPGSFVDVEQSFVVKKGDRDKAAALDRLVAELRASGFVAAAIERAKLAGVAVAPARQR